MNRFRYDRLNTRVSKLCTSALVVSFCFIPYFSNDYNLWYGILWNSSNVKNTQKSLLNGLVTIIVLESVNSQKLIG